MSDPTSGINDYDELIENGRRLVAQAQEAIENSKRVFAEHGIDPQESLEYLRKHGGEPAVQAQVETIMKQIEDDVERRRVHEPKQRPAGKRPPRVRNMI